MKTVNILRRKTCFVSDIILLKSDANYTHVFFRDGKQLTVAKTLKKMEATFSELGFIRTHKSYIVNPTHILKYYEVDSEIQLTKNLKAAVSRRRKDALEQVLQN
ncbi:LytR/AlgR family response regulator transcription factor [Jiulongibacter sp. NS-SX5]|uniref:LytR/AlgR family response regulator transcription factor n=1 Tax=Jiulongibacter sp. NS-SX5 TaxID=3463854 RepID=UPI0040598E3D